MKISIVTINLNNKDGLEKTIRSVINQTYFDNIEYVIIDGGSSDGSKEIIEQNNDKISYWCSEPDKGIFNAFNKSLNHLNGEYVLFLNSGDFLISDTIIEEAIKHFDNSTIIYGDEIFYSKTKNLLQKYPKVLNELFFKTNALPHQSTFVKVDYQKRHLYPETYKVLGDWSLLREAIMVEKVSYLHIPITVSMYEMNGFSNKNANVFYKERKDYYKNIQQNDLSIFICSHKDFEKQVKSKCYRIVDARTNEIQKRNGLDDKFYSEFLSFYNVSKYKDLPKYVGFCHYRRYFSFLDKIPDMDKIFNEYDAIVVKQIIFEGGVRRQYASAHNIEDLEIIEEIIKKDYPNYYKGFENFLDGHVFIPYNMFIMKREDFMEYINFINDVLDKYLKIVGTDINKRIEDNKDKYLKSFSPNNTIEYQYRIGGYLGERLTNLFYITHFKKLGTYQVVITENKYNLKNNTI